MASSQQPQSTPTDPIHPMPQGLRTAVSFVLFVHLFSVSVILLGYTGNSELTREIRARVPGMQPYLRFLWMDLNYDYADYRYSYSQSDGANINYVIEAHLTFADQSVRRVPVFDAVAWPEMRHQRYLTLAKEFAREGENSGEEAAHFAMMIGSCIMHEYENAKQVEIQCRRVFAPGTEPSQEAEPDLIRSEEGIAYVVVYQGKVWRDPYTDQLEFSKGEARRMLAPRPKSADKSEPKSDGESSEPSDGEE